MQQLFFAWRPSKLCEGLGENAHNLNDAIAALVKKGLPEMVQQALDTVRVIGNNAVHPGQIDVGDQPATAESLFKLVNLVVQRMITDLRETEEIYNTLPESARDAIARRDSSE